MTVLQMKHWRWTGSLHVTDFLWTRLQRGRLCVDSEPLSSVWGHLDRRERQFITLQRGKDKPHLMKQPRQSCIKSHRTVSCSCNLHAALIPAVGQWHSRHRTVGQAASSQLLAARAPFVKYCHGYINGITAHASVRFSKQHVSTGNNGGGYVPTDWTINLLIACSLCRGVQPFARDLWLVLSTFYHPCSHCAPPPSNKDEGNVGLWLCQTFKKLF